MNEKFETNIIDEVKSNSVVLKTEIYSMNMVPQFFQKEMINEEQYKKYCYMFESQKEIDVISRMREHISRITFDQLLYQLNCCMDALENLINSNHYYQKPIILSNDVGHSQEWVNKLVYPRLLPLLADRLQVVEIAHPPHHQKEIIIQLSDQLRNTNMATHLYFDDCSYSGTQISRYIQTLIIGINKQLPLPQGAKINIILVVPYMTITAIQVIKDRLERTKDFLNSSFEINFELINSGKIARIRDIPLSEKDKKVFLKSMETNEDKTLTITDWKLPDYVSFPSFFMKGHTKRSFREQTEPTPFLPQEEFKPYG